MAAITRDNGKYQSLDRYSRYVVIAIATLMAVGMSALAIVLFGGRILPPAIEITPERFAPFDRPVCPGEAVYRSVTYVINRPSVMEIDAVIQDLDRARPLPDTAISSVRPSPYAIKETTPFTFTAPDLPPGRYEWRVGVTPKNQSSVTAWWFIEFAIAEDCPAPTPEAAP